MFCYTHPLSTLLNRGGNYQNDLVSVLPGWKEIGFSKLKGRHLLFSSVLMVNFILYHVYLQWQDRSIVFVLKPYRDALEMVVGRGGGRSKGHGTNPMLQKLIPGINLQCSINGSPSEVFYYIWRKSHTLQKQMYNTQEEREMKERGYPGRYLCEKDVHISFSKKRVLK